MMRSMYDPLGGCNSYNHIYSHVPPLALTSLISLPLNYSLNSQLSRRSIREEKNGREQAQVSTREDAYGLAAERERERELN